LVRAADLDVPRELASPVAPDERDDDHDPLLPFTVEEIAEPDGPTQPSSRGIEKPRNVALARFIRRTG
jgi:hypothetical protein